VDLDGDYRQILWQRQRYPLALPGSVQLTNAAVALTALEVLQQGWRIPDEAIHSGFARVHWPGRLQKVVINGSVVWLDGAHNRPAAEALRHFVEQTWGRESVIWVMGILEQKDAQGILQALLRGGDTFYGLPISGHAALSAEGMCTLALQVQPQLNGSHTLQDLDAFSRLMAQFAEAENSSPVICCGSLYLLCQVMQQCMG
jgi:dihydrofolate synthase/folylpolyglutamate synthase